MLDDGIGFSLVPWCPVIEEHFGRELRGIAIGADQLGFFQNAGVRAIINGGHRRSEIGVWAQAAGIFRSVSELWMVFRGFSYSRLLALGQIFLSLALMGSRAAALVS